MDINPEKEGKYGNKDKKKGCIRYMPNNSGRAKFSKRDSIAEQPFSDIMRTNKNTVHDISMILGESSISYEDEIFQ